MANYKNIFIKSFYAFLFFTTIVSAIYLYFGFANFKITILFYVLLCLAATKLVDLLNNRFKFSINPNIKILIVTTGLSLLCGEFALRFVFKKNLTYSEKNGGGYISSYTYRSSKKSIQKYLFDKGDYWYLKNKPNTVKRINIDGVNFEHIYNSLGFREDEKPPQGDDAQYLITGIGDSFAEGLGADGDSTWLRFMARKLNTDSACKVRTYNAGIAGSDVFFEYVVLEKYLEQYHPNMVVLGINTSDIDDIIIKGGRNRFLPNGRLQYNSAPWWEKLYGVSFIFRALIHARNNYDWTLLTFEEKEIKKQEAIDSIELSVHRFQALAKQKGFNLVVAFHPRENELHDFPFALDSLADKLAADTNLNVVNLNRRFAQTGAITPQNSAKYYWKYDLHHNASGYKVMGDLIAGFIRSKGLVCTAKK